MHLDTKSSLNSSIIMVHISLGENEVVLSSLAKKGRTPFDSFSVKGCSVCKLH